MRQQQIRLLHCTGAGSGGGARNAHCHQPLHTKRRQRQRERERGGVDWHLQKSDFAMWPGCPVVSVSVSVAAAGDTVGAPDLSYTPGLDSGCTASQGA